MLIEVTQDNLRDLAAAVNAALRREPPSVLRGVQDKLLRAIQRREETLEISREEAVALRDALLKRAYDQRRTTEAWDYSELADRLDRALRDAEVPFDEDGVSG